VHLGINVEKPRYDHLIGVFAGEKIFTDDFLQKNNENVIYK
jgi:hypothetical protein